MLSATCCENLTGTHVFTLVVLGMEKTSYLKENGAGFMKENSPPFITKDADVCEQHTFGDNGFKTMEKHGKFSFLSGV